MISANLVIEVTQYITYALCFTAFFVLVRTANDLYERGLNNTHYYVVAGMSIWYPIKVAYFIPLNSSLDLQLVILNEISAWAFISMFIKFALDKSKELRIHSTYNGTERRQETKINQQS